MLNEPCEPIATPVGHDTQVSTVGKVGGVTVINAGTSASSDKHQVIMSATLLVSLPLNLSFNLLDSQHAPEGKKEDADRVEPHPLLHQRIVIYTLTVLRKATAQSSCPEQHQRSSNPNERGGQQADYL